MVDWALSPTHEALAQKGSPGVGVGVGQLPEYTPFSLLQGKALCLHRPQTRLPRRWGQSVGLTRVARLPWWLRVENPPALRETLVQSLGRGRSPGEGNGNQSSILAWRSSMDGGAWRATVHGWGSKESDTTERPSTQP